MSLLDIDNIEEQSLYKYLAETYAKIREHKFGRFSSVKVEHVYGGIIGEIDNELILTCRQSLGPILMGIDYIHEYIWISKNHKDIDKCYILYNSEGSSHLSQHVTPNLVQSLIPKYDHILNNPKHVNI